MRRRGRETANSALGWSSIGPQADRGRVSQRPFIMGLPLPGQPLDGAPPGSNHGIDWPYNGPIFSDSKAKAAHREPIAYQHRAGDPDQRTGGDVAQMVRQQHQPAND